MRKRRKRTSFRLGLDREELALFAKNAAIIVVSVIVLVGVCLFNIAKLFAGADTFAKGVYVDDVELYGMTYDEAARLVEKNTEQYLESLKIPIIAGDKSYSFNALEFVSADVDATLDKAFSVGKSESAMSLFADGDGASMLYTTYHVDTDKLMGMIETIAEETDVEAKEPAAVFDKEKRTFTFEEGKTGKKLKTDEALNSILERIEKNDYSKLELTYETQYPKHTVAQIKANTKLIAEFTSITTDNYNRNVNIGLMCSYVNGYELKPNAILSINELVGERTTEKGFLPAPAIMDGKRTVDDMGGGICQLSGTLYNTALLANMRIVERTPHSWPSDYLEIGLDSTLDWASQKDLKIQNVTEYSMYIVAWLEKSDLSVSNVLHVAIYGQPFPEGMTVKVRSEIVNTYEPEEAKVVYTSSLPEGVTQVLVKARTGYRTQAWRDFYYNGVLIDSEIVNTSYYAPIQGELKKGTGVVQSKPTSAPTDAPTPTPTPASEPTPTSDPTIPPPDPTDPIVGFGD